MKVSNLKRCAILFLLCSLIVLGVPINVFADTSDESKYSIAFGKEYSLEDIKWNNDKDCYHLSLNVPEKGRFRVKLENISNLDSLNDNFNASECDYFSNYNGSNRFWTKKGDKANSGWISVDRGIKNFLFDFYSGINRADAILTVEFEPARDYNGELESNDTFATATYIQSGIEYHGDYSHEVYRDYDDNIDYDYFYFCLDNPSLVKICMKKTTDVGYAYNVPFDLYLEDKNGNKKVVFSKSSEDNRTMTEDNLRLPSGKYFLKANVYAKHNAEYSLMVDYSADEINGYYEKEFNNYSSSANVIEPKQWYVGNINDEDDIDWYQLIIDENRHINIELMIPEQMGGDNVDVVLYDEEFKVINKMTTTNDSYYKSSTIAGSAGIYYIKVYPGYNRLDNVYDYMLRVNADTIIEPLDYVDVAHITYNKIKLTWEKIEGVAGYNIYTKKGTSKVLSKRGFTEEDEFTVGSLADGSKYTFVIEPCIYEDDEYIPAEYARTEVSAYTLSKVIQNAPRKYNSTNVKISWKSVTGVDGYEVQKLSKKNGRLTPVSISSTTATSMNISAKKNTTYYYKVRAFKVVEDEKVYAPWSTVKSYKL